MDNTLVTSTRPLRVVLSSSLQESALNQHILFEIKSVLQQTASVEYIAPDNFIQRDDLSNLDLLLYVGSSVSEYSPLKTMSDLARHYGMASVFWATEDPYEFDARNRANGFDVYFSNDRNAADNFLEREHVYHLPLAAAIGDRRDIKAYNDRKIGLFFCGYPYQNRQRAIADILSDSRFSQNDLLVMGADWKMERLRHFVGSDYRHDDVIELYTLSMCTLLLGRTFDIANAQRKVVATTIGPRGFECSLAGTPQISLGHSLEIEEYYEPGEEILLADSVDDVADYFNFFRRHPESWFRIAQAAQLRTMNEHLYSHRINKMFSVLRDVGIISSAGFRAVSLNSAASQVINS